MRRLVSSTPSVVYLVLHGAPRFGDGLKQSSAIDENPMSLPPMCSVHTVSADRESNCGGFGRGDTFWVCVMSSASAPVQLGSRNSA